MPIFKFREKLILYSHIPKCAGQSIENYCQRLGAKIAFMDNDFCLHMRKNTCSHWCNGSSDQSELKQ